MSSDTPNAPVKHSSSYSSREFSVLVNIMNEIKQDARDIMTQVGDLRSDLSGLAGDMRTTNKEVEYLREDVRRITTECERLRSIQDGCPARQNYTSDISRVEKIEDMRHCSPTGSDSPTMATVAKYIGIILAGFVIGVGSLAAAWVQLSTPKKQSTVQVIEKSLPQYAPKQSQQEDVDTEKQWEIKP